MLLIVVKLALVFIFVQQSRWFLLSHIMVVVELSVVKKPKLVHVFFNNIHVLNHTLPLRHT